MRKGLKSSIFQRIFIPMLIVALLQVVLLYAVFGLSGLYKTFDDNAEDLLVESTRNKYQVLQNEMVNEWTYFGNTEDVIDGIIQKELDAENKKWDDIHTDAALNEAIVEKTSSELVNRLRKTKTTGIFMILDGVAVQGKEDTYAGFYLRNRDPGTETTDNSDLGVLRGLPPVSRALGIPLESFWKASFTFDGGRDNPDNEYFYNPLDAARETGITKSANCCYWGHPTQMGDSSDINVITYSVPMINDAGEVYGVLGIELSTKYIVSQICGNAPGNLSDQHYYIGITTDEGNSYTEILSSDSKSQVGDIAADSKTDRSQGWMITADRGAGKTVYGSVFPLKIYSNNAPFSEEQWVLVGFQDEDTLFKAGSDFKRLTLISFAIILMLNVVVSIAAAFRIVRPVRMFARKLNENDDYEEIAIPTTNVVELDVLADAITDMNHGIIESAKRTSQLFELSGLPVGVYELRDNAQYAYCSDGFFSLLNCEEMKGEQNLISEKLLNEILSRVTTNALEDNIYVVEKGNHTSYLRITTQQDERGVIGTILDVSNEVENRKRIERERDYDTLTNIWNRRAFEHRLENYFEKTPEKLGVAAMIMFDLDNLKAVNDSYGHDSGDLYIRTFATYLGKFMSDRSIVARRSGDEFYMFIYGCNSKEEVREQIDACWDKVNNQSMMLPDQSVCKVRVSAGYAWYPDDATTLQRLIHYADFAMYYAKQTSKGSIMEFDSTDYDHESFLFNGHEALNRLIDYHMVDFMFQPVVSAYTGELYGYELLMRSQIEELKNPEIILRMAKSQGKLNHIEKITWFQGMEAVQRGLDEGYLDSNAHYFINSIANQALTNDELQELRQLHTNLFPNVVLEVTEGENNDQELTNHKMSWLRQTGGQIAIDDYGTGYNSELALVMIPAQIVKIDMTFVRDVDSDEDKQLIIKNLIRFAKARQIKVLAEGVESRAEMETLIGFGVDYLQGYYIATPKYVPVINDGVQEEIRKIAKQNNA